MQETLKCTRLDLLLLKPYLKSMCLVLLVPLLITFFTGTLFEGLFFAATVLAMTTGYTFSIVEKNQLNRFYGFLPVKRNALVFGRYLTIFLSGFAALLFTLAIQTVILTYKAQAPAFQELLLSVLVCACMFCIYAGVQIPGYYRFGSIKGKMFMFIPTVGFLLFYYLVRLLIGDTGSLQLPWMQNYTAILVCTVLFMALVIAVSAAISTKIIAKD